MSEDPGVYLFLGKRGEILYVGKAKNLKKRVSSYFRESADLGPKTQALVGKAQRIRTIIANSELESLLLEANLIKKYNPRYNAKLTDGKSYLRIKITTSEKSPRILMARMENEKGSLYFGPFPNSNDVKVVLKLIRRVFPYQSARTHPKRYCLYYHLGLCPCPPMFKTQEEFRDYKKNIRHVIEFLNGQTKKIINELKLERDKESKNENFEIALEIQRKIDAILMITSSTRSPFEYEESPNLRSDLRNKELDELLSVLRTNNVLVQKLDRIECYDISNIGGAHATGSMVVFSNGERETSNYRRFQIKRPPKVIPNDFAMFAEVIRRRFTHPEWGMPDLIIVDGGKGQVSSVNKTVLEQNIDVPVVGIAKAEELLITSNFKIIKLPKNSNALNLVRRIRDEAHRFAITYHRKLRSKFIFG